MSKYFYDPREMQIKPESGVTWEEDNREEPMWRWGAAILDLCELPVEEYMKPMSVLIANTEGDDYDVTNVVIYASLVEPEEEGQPWKVKLNWTGEFTTMIGVAVKVKDHDGTTILVSGKIGDNAQKMMTIDIPNSEEEAKMSIFRIGIAKDGTSPTKITASTYTELNKEEKIRYEFSITTDKSKIALTLRYIIDSMAMQSYTDVLYGDPIPEFTGSTDKKGYEFIGWFDASGLSYTTMPSHDLNLYAKYKKTTDMYYGLLLYNDISNLANDDELLSGMGFYADIPNEDVMHLTIEQDADYDEKYYANAEETLSDSDYAAYLNTISKDVTIILPKGVSASNYSFMWTDGGLEKLEFEQVKDITIDGDEHTVWMNNHIENINGFDVYGYHPSVEKSTDYSITLKKLQ